MNSIGQIIRYYRKKAGMSQAELAENLCSREYLGLVERDSHSPSVEMVKLLSERLNVNLLAAYDKIKNFESVEMYSEMSELSKEIERRNVSRINEIIAEKSELPQWQMGEPYQKMCYARAFVADTPLEKIEWAEKGIRVSLGSISKVQSFPNYLSKAEFALLLSYATGLNRSGNHSEAFSVLNEISRRARFLIDNESNSPLSDAFFWTKMLNVCAYNYYVFSKTVDEKTLNRIDEALTYMKVTRCDYLLPELLLCKAAISMNNARKDEAIDYYNKAKLLWGIFNSNLEFEPFAKVCIDCHSEYSMFLNEK